MELGLGDNARGVNGVACFSASRGTLASKCLDEANIRTEWYLAQSSISLLLF